MFLCPLLFIGALVFLFMFVLPRGRRYGDGPWNGGNPFQGPGQDEQEHGQYKSAQATLADRFARGEIDEDEFMRRRQALK